MAEINPIIRLLTMAWVAFWKVGLLRYFALLLTVVLVCLFFSIGRKKPINSGKWACILIGSAFLGESYFFIWMYGAAQDPSTRGALVAVASFLVHALIPMLISGWMWWRFIRRLSSEGEVLFQGGTGPPIECPRCSQETVNHSFCEICGRDIRENPPPLILPDGTRKTEGKPNLAIPADRNPRERGLRPLNSNR